MTPAYTKRTLLNTMLRRHTLLLNPRYSALQEYIVGLPERFEAEGTFIYGGPRNLIKSFQAPDGTLLNVKRYKRPVGPNLLVYSSGVRKPKGLRAFIYAGRLHDIGIDTPEAVAYIEERTMGLLRDSYFVSIQSNLSHRLYEMGDATADEYEPMAEALAQFTARMHEAGVLHRDYSPGNILWEKGRDGYHFTIVDINRMYFGEVSVADGCANFARLWGPKRFIVLLAEHYAAARGMDRQQAVDIALQARQRFWKRMARKEPIPFPYEP